MKKKQKLNTFRQYLDILCEEINIKVIFFATCEKGSIGYNSITKEFIIK